MTQILRRQSGFSRRMTAFTLVELLVVIGIISILIGILLPGLSSARRSANRIKCQASLREIGTSFQLYANEYKGVWPVAVHEPNVTAGIRLPIDVERRWYDLVAKYMTKKNISTSAEIVQIRQNSVIWGCPEWARKDFPFESLDDYRPGYGMNYYVGTYFDTPNPGSKFLTDYVYILGSRARGDYVKQNKWAKGRSAEKGVIADSMTHIINVPGYPAYDYATVATNGWQPQKTGNILTGTPGGTAFYVEAGRHLKPSAKVDDKVQGMNMLFCDGHVSPVSVREAWAAITLKQPQ
ncbi:MAG: hypothetical protein QOF78_576 [Phycisphaerales bacterium]|nr:hypothetical protein [Phycisphaerales bacterium]